MRGPTLENIKTFLAQHNDGRVIGRVPGMLGMAVTSAEAEFRQRLLTAGYSGSYLALLSLTATLTFDAGQFFPAGDSGHRDQGEWHGYHRGLQTALACLVMHETGSNPQQAAMLVADHTETLIRCRWTTRSAKGGG